MTFEQQAIKKQKGGYKQIQPRWLPGQSGNPAGRPVNSVTTLIKNTDAATTQQIYEKIIQKVLDGDYSFLKEYLERSDGKVAEKKMIASRVVFEVEFKSKPDYL